MIFAALKNKLMSREIEKRTKKNEVDRNCDVKKSLELKNVDRI